MQHLISNEQHVTYLVRIRGRHLCPIFVSPESVQEYFGKEKWRPVDNGTLRRIALSYCPVMCGIVDLYCIVSHIVLHGIIRYDDSCCKYKVDRYKHESS